MERGGQAGDVRIPLSDPEFLQDIDNRGVPLGEQAAVAFMVRCVDQFGIHGL